MATDTPALQRFELTLIAQLLAEAADRHQQHTCNDHFLPDGAEQRRMIEAAYRYSAAIGEQGQVGDLDGAGGLFVFDFVLMRYLAARCALVAGDPNALPQEFPRRQLEAAELGEVAVLLEQLGKNDFEEYAARGGDPDLILPVDAEHRPWIRDLLSLTDGPRTRLPEVKAVDSAIGIHAVRALEHLARRCREVIGRGALGGEIVPVPMTEGELLTLGTYKAWKSEKALLKDALVRLESIVPNARQDHEKLQRYAAGDNPFQDIIDPSKPRKGPLMLGVVSALHGASTEGNVELERQLYSGVAPDSWMPVYQRVTAFAYWQWCIDCQARATWMPTFLPQGANLLADCLVLGWMDQAHVVVECMRAIYGRRLFWSGVSGRNCMPLYHWLLRVVFDYFEMPFAGWGRGRRMEHDPKSVFAKNQCFGEVPLNTLFDHWRDADLRPLQAHLNWLCDYYTHRTRGADGMEFASGSRLHRHPALILAFLRLRGQLGLDTADIDHPLMRAPYAALPAPQPVYTDALLEQVLDRLRREELPNLGGSLDTAIRFVDSR